MRIIQIIVELMLALFYLGQMLITNAFILLWNLLVFGLLIWGFVWWWGFLFGSVVAVILVLIFAPYLFLLPAAIGRLFIPFACVENIKKLSKEK